MRTDSVHIGHMAADHGQARHHMGSAPAGIPSGGAINGGSSLLFVIGVVAFVSVMSALFFAVGNKPARVYTDSDAAPR